MAGFAVRGRAEGHGSAVPPQGQQVAPTGGERVAGLAGGDHGEGAVGVGEVRHEAQAGAGGSHFAVIMDSLTVDAWVCMIVLALMMLASFYIMARKGRQIGAASKGNRQFMALYQQHDGDFASIQQALPAAAESPLSRMFKVGRTEVGKRVAKATDAALSSQSIEAIRAWVRGELRMMESRALGGHAMGAARDLRGAPRFAAYAAGQAGAVAHVAEHDLGAAAYAIKAVRASVPAASADEAGRAECAWQRERLPAAVRELVLSDQQRRNDLCWGVFT